MRSTTTFFLLSSGSKYGAIGTGTQRGRGGSIGHYYHSAIFSGAMFHSGLHGSGGGAISGSSGGGGPA